jgi:hypothetical protein
MANGQGCPLPGAALRRRAARGTGYWPLGQYRSFRQFRVARCCEPILAKSIAYQPFPITPRNTEVRFSFVQQCPSAPSAGADETIFLVRRSHPATASELNDFSRFGHPRLKIQFLWPNAIDQSQFKTNETGLRETRSPRLAAAEAKRMTDEQLALQAVRDAQQILEEYLEPRPRNNERVMLDKLVELLERPDLLVAVTRMQNVR